MKSADHFRHNKAVPTASRGVILVNARTVRRVLRIPYVLSPESGFCNTVARHVFSCLDCSRYALLGCASTKDMHVPLLESNEEILW